MSTYVYSDGARVTYHHGSDIVVVTYGTAPTAWTVAATSTGEIRIGQPYAEVSRAWSYRPRWEPTDESKEQLEARLKLEAAERSRRATKTHGVARRRERSVLPAPPEVPARLGRTCSGATRWRATR